MGVEELITYLNQEGDIYCVFDAEDIIGNKAIKVAESINLEEYRWHSVGMDVYQCDDGYVGVKGPCKLYSETSSWKDLCYPCLVKECIEVPIITYAIKK